MSTRPKYKGWPRGIDSFFASLGENWGKRAAMIILSGAGDDGTEGARIIRQQQGLVIVQDLETAAHGSMPGSVIEAGLANTVLAPEEMPHYLLDYFGIRLPEAAELSSEALAEEKLEELVQELQQQTGHDFSGYKPGLLQRQIAYRMCIPNSFASDTILSNISQKLM